MNNNSIKEKLLVDVFEVLILIDVFEVLMCVTVALSQSPPF
jgi:uncharacterized membrane protein (DUF373 family)